MHDNQEQAAITLRYDSELEPGRYLHVRSDFVWSESLSASAKVLYLVLCSYAALGLHALPGWSHLAQECGIAESALMDAVGELTEIGLVTPEDESRTAYHVHGLERAVLNGGPSEKYLPESFPRKAGLHIPIAHNTAQIEKDKQLLIEQLGISEEIAVSLAQLAAGRGCSEGYVADVVGYATTTLGIKNPAGCVVELIRRNERRRPAAHVQQSREQDTRHTLDPEKYTSGKYAFLFRPRQPGSTETDGDPSGEHNGNGSGSEGNEL